MHEKQVPYRLADFSDPGAEERRLAEQAATLASWEGDRLAEAGLHGALRIVEIGCGPGHVLRGLSRTCAAHLIGVDIDAAALAMAPDGVLRLRAEGSFLPLRTGCADLVIFRFSLVYMPDPERSLKEAWRLLRPGGAVLVEEADHLGLVLDPEPPGWPALIRARQSTLRRRGGDLLRVRSLHRLLDEAGFGELHSAVLAVSTALLPPPQFLRLVLTPAAEGIDERDLDHERIAMARTELGAWASGPDAFGVCLLRTCIGRVRP